MDFISNLIKRPISLVLNETSNAMDKYPLSASLPNPKPNGLDKLDKKDLKSVAIENGEQDDSENSSHNDEHHHIMTDFIGVPEEFLDEFKDILPPPPLPLQNTLNPLTQSLLDMEITHSLSITPPPPPLTPSMKASQTIDELLSQINDNLQLAGINDEVLAIAPPPPSPHKSELSPLSSKSALNNSKLLSGSSAIANTQLNTSKTPPKAAGPASLTVFENNSSLHKFPIDPELETCQIFDDQQATKDQGNTSGVNKSSNKFAGLTEFDEAKIPELPADLNPNIEEQYNVTFEKCFMPTIKSNQNSAADSEEESKVDKTHYVLPAESDVASDNETFADCTDDKDPLASTFAETASANVTTDADSYQSAFNNTLSSNFNHTMENIADITLEAVGGESPVENQVVEVVSQFQPMMNEDEPMDVDMNVTMEMLHNTSNNIQNVEKVIQHAENILQHLEDRKPLKEPNNLIQQKENEFVTNRLPENQINESNEKSKELSGPETCLNKNNELPVTEIKAEYHYESGDLNKSQKENIIGSGTKTDLSKDAMNLSSNSNSSAKLSEKDLNFSLNLGKSANSQQNSPPSSPTFPMKITPNAGFPRSPRAAAQKQVESPFLEKSDYSPNLDSHNALHNINADELEPRTTNDVNKTFLEPANPTDNAIKRRTFAVINSPEEPNENNADLRNKHQTLSIDGLVNEQDAMENRRTFSLNTNENASNKLMKFPSMDKKEINRRTFNANDIESVLAAAKVDTNSRRTFNLPNEEIKSDSAAEQNDLNTSFEPMEVDDNNISQNTSIPIAVIKEQEIQNPSAANINNLSQDHAISNNRNTILSESPPLPTMQPKVQSTPSPTAIADNNNKIVAEVSPVQTMEEQFSPSSSLTFTSKPLPTLIQKRPPIRDARARAADILSAKEQSNIKVKDEKDVLVEKLTPSPTEEARAGLSASSSSLTNYSGFSGIDQSSSSRSSVDDSGEQQSKELNEDEFTGSNNLILNPSDFDYLLTKGNNNAPVDRSSLLLKFDPLLGVPVPVNQGQPQLPTYTNNNNNPSLSPTLEEDEHNDSNRSFVVATKTEASAKLLRERTQEVKQPLQLEQQIQQNRRQLTQGVNKKYATMSVDVIKDMSLDNDCNKTFENSNSTQSEDKQTNYKMDELEKKIKNEVLKTEDIEKKLKDAEQREEALIKRITEKDKTITKMTGVIEAYEKAIAELIADKEQLTQNYEKQLAEVKADRDSNYHHLTSLETTFSDLHVKYEKSKEMTCQLKESEEALQAEKRKNLENLHLQEQRYDKMKNHAMQQLEIANKKLESLTREHSIEITKLKALLKKEEIARSSINEQLAHKTKENAELVKICDELISGQGSNFAFEPFDPKKH